MFIKIMEFLKKIFKKEEFFEDELEYINYYDSYISELNKCNIEEKTNVILE
tara:strand:+ start:306 stop:458 length:153 start_codon:yes stop_codon:yes gene_type:complete